MAFIVDPTRDCTLLHPRIHSFLLGLKIIEIFIQLSTRKENKTKKKVIEKLMVSHCLSYNMKREEYIETAYRSNPKRGIELNKKSVYMDNLLLKKNAKSNYSPILGLLKNSTKRLCKIHFLNG